MLTIYSLILDEICIELESNDASETDSHPMQCGISTTKPNFDSHVTDMFISRSFLFDDYVAPTVGEIKWMRVVNHTICLFSFFPLRYHHDLHPRFFCYFFFSLRFLCEYLFLS